MEAECRSLGTISYYMQRLRRVALQLEAHATAADDRELFDVPSPLNEFSCFRD